MRRSLLAGIAVLFAASAASAEPLASLTVTIDGVSNKGGDLRVGVYDAAQFAVRGAKPLAGKIVAATPGESVVTFDDLKPGIYGVKTFQDENKNGKIDLTMGIMPAEPYGFSNDAKLDMGPPPFDAAKITLAPGPNATTIHLR